MEHIFLKKNIYCTTTTCEFRNKVLLVVFREIGKVVLKFERVQQKFKIIETPVQKWEKKSS